MIFVTNDTNKGDWFHSELKTGIYPKAELFEEFHKATSGNHIKIIDFQKFLELFKLELRKVPQETTKPQNIETERVSPQFENDFNTQGIDLKEGMIIDHKEYGRGKIISIIGRSEDEIKIVTISFEGDEEKQFMLHLLKDIRVCTS